MPVTRIDVPLENLDTRVQTEEELQRRLAAERARLSKQLNLKDSQLSHFRRPVERPFTAEERGKVTILFGGLTWKHERLIQAVFKGCGYRCEIVPVPNVAAFQLGKEYGNNGQCNPTYFTVGNLVQYLQSLEGRGMPKQEIIDNCDLVGDCWVYRSASPNGYGMKYIQGKMRTASCLHAARCSPSISRRMPATSGSALTRLAATLGICSGAATQRTASRGSRRSARSSAGPLRFRR